MASAAPLPDPPKRPRAQRPDRTPGPAPRRRSLTREAIVEASIKVLDAEGLDAMTMRRVAQELDTGAASLYAHVADKEELIELVVDRVIGELDVPDALDPDQWQEQLKQMGRAMRATLGRHGDIARASFARVPLGPNALRGMEPIVAVMRAGGLPDQVVAYAADLLGLYVTAVAYEDSIYSQLDISPERAAEYISGMREYLAALPSDRFPTLKALAGPLTAGAEGDERFEFGLEVLVRGLEAMAKDGS